MRKSLTIAVVAAMMPLSASAGAQDLGRILGGVAREVLDDRASEAPAPAPRFGGPGALVRSWDSLRPVRFDHVIEGHSGPVTLILDGRTLDGNQTVAVYRADANGVRITGWRLFVITTRDGNSATGTLTLPRPKEGESVGRQPLIVMVENHSGRRSRGEFALRMVP